jgi:putative component of membrane protein insertase Oxa1/YidC/SpoIIIJ protein YidD
MDFYQNKVFMKKGINLNKKIHSKKEITICHPFNLSAYDPATVEKNKKRNERLLQDLN